MSIPVSTPIERATLTVDEAAARLGISRTLAYGMAQRGDIPTIRLGRRVLVLRQALEQMLEPESRTAPDPERR